MNINSVVLIGRLVKDPELRYTQQNIPCVEFTVAVNNGKNKDGSERKPDFINCLVWDKQAESMAKYTQKGNLVAIDGILKVNSYDGDDGKRHYKTYVLAHRIQFLDTKKKESPLPEPPEHVVNKVNAVEDPYAIMGKQVEAEFTNEYGDNMPF